MSIRINLDVQMARRKMSLNELSRSIGISTTNLSLLKTGKVKGIRFATLSAICDVLRCQAGDILEYTSDHDNAAGADAPGRQTEVHNVG
ncbi:MAG: helix-turn-helix transcriptional regulator [Pseudomonadota bacterium]